jgi:TPR repeat protein
MQYPCKAASQSHPSRFNKFGGRLEYDGEIESDLMRAVRYYHMAAGLENSSPQKDFGILLECGIGIQSNHALAAHCFEPSAMQANDMEQIIWDDASSTDTAFARTLK